MELIEVFKKHPEWRLILAGYGGDEELIQRQAKGLGNVSWHGRVNYENAIKMSSEADTFVATYNPAIPNHRHSSPNKMFEAMMLGKPIIVAENTNMDKIVDKWEMGLIVKYGDLPDLEAALSTLHKDPELRKQMGKNARGAYDKEYSWSRMQKRLLDMYHDVEMGD